MLKVLRQYSALITMLALVLGAMLSPLFQFFPGHESRIDMTALKQDASVYKSLPVIIAGDSETPAPFKAALSQQPPDEGEVDVLIGNEKVKILVADQLAAQLYGCSSREPMRAPDGYWFRGELTESDITANSVRAFGTLYQCDPKGVPKMRKWVHLKILTTGVSGYRLRAFASFPQFLSECFITVLLMLFIPTLAFSVLRSIVESGGAFSRFRGPTLYFLATGLIAAAVGCGSGYLFYTEGPLSHTELVNIAESAGASDVAPAKPPYDAHPVLTLLHAIIPKNPLAVVADSSGNTGLQVAFVCIIVGVLLALLDSDSRRRVSEFLNKSLALVIHDNKFSCTAFSDIVDVLTPFGIFFVTLTVGATLTISGVMLLWILCMAVFVGLAIHTLLLFAWLAWRRNLRDWLAQCVRPSMPGFVVAFLTASSYAALSSLNQVEYLKTKPMRRGILDLGTVLNKNGTAVYIATAAAFLLASQRETAAVWQYFCLIPLSALAAIATAGLPFAAVIGLRMALSLLAMPTSQAWLILPIDLVIDRFVTAVNVFANLAACSEAKARPVRDLRSFPELVAETQ